MKIKTVKKFIWKDKVVSYTVFDTKDKEYSVSLSEDNTDYQTILEWVAEGNTIEEAD